MHSAATEYASDRRGEGIVEDLTRLTLYHLNGLRKGYWCVFGRLRVSAEGLFAVRPESGHLDLESTPCAQTN